jgi:hypothetical protein
MVQNVKLDHGFLNYTDVTSPDQLHIKTGTMYKGVDYNTLSTFAQKFVQGLA